jgi:hypothetical protein
VSERRSCGTGTKGPRLADWALTATASPRHFLLIRRLISRPPGPADVLPVLGAGGQAGDDAVLHHHRRAPLAEETFKTGKDVLGWDQCQARAWDPACRHTALSALAQLRQAAIRNALCGLIRLPPAGGTGSAPAGRGSDTDAGVDDADLRIPSATLPFPPTLASPARAGSARSNCRSPRPPGSPAWPPTGQPGSSPAPAWRSGCAGQPGAGATRPPPGCTTTQPAWQRRQPDPQAAGRR